MTKSAKAANRLPVPVRHGSGYTMPSHFDGKINRWTGEPHKNEREIARRARQNG